MAVPADETWPSETPAFAPARRNRWERRKSRIADDEMMKILQGCDNCEDEPMPDDSPPNLVEYRAEFDGAKEGITRDIHEECVVDVHRDARVYREPN